LTVPTAYMRSSARAAARPTRTSSPGRPSPIPWISCCTTRGARRCRAGPSP
jgi:hypothetical protein